MRTCNTVQRIEPPDRIFACMDEANHQGTHSFMLVKECFRCGNLIKITHVHSCTDTEALMDRLRGIHLALNQIGQLLNMMITLQNATVDLLGKATGIAIQRGSGIVVP